MVKAWGQEVVIGSGPLYFSPGIQIGLHLGSGYYISYQLTTGLYTDDAILFPGITLGKRHYYYKKEKKVESFTYVDGQLNLLFGSFEVGKMWNSDGESFTKTKLSVAPPTVNSIIPL